MNVLETNRGDHCDVLLKIILNIHMLNKNMSFCSGYHDCMFIPLPIIKLIYILAPMFYFLP